MGYYTDHSLYDVLDYETQLSIDMEDQFKALANYLNHFITPNENFDEKIIGHRWWEILELITKSYVNATWYNEEENMLEFSEHFPELVFILDGDGEEGDDVWQSAYHNGMCNTRYVESPVADTINFRKG